MLTRSLRKRILQLLLAGVVFIYFFDWIVLALRPPALSSVPVEQFLRTPLKGQKEEFDYMGTVAQPCVRSLFPHRSDTPCWWLQRHRIQWISP
jgi:hypothetical protein